MMIRSLTRLAGVLAVALLLCGAPSASAPGGSTRPGSPGTSQPGNVDYDMYFNSPVFDDPQCAMEAVDGRLRIDPALTNAAMSCPDMLAWKVFIETVRQNFITEWTSGDLMWPAEPLPLCPSAQGQPCCMPGSSSNPGYSDSSDPGRHCPFYTGGRNQPVVAALTAHRKDNSRVVGLPEMHGPVSITTKPVSFYNRSMYDYAFKNNLYNSDGLVTVLNNANADLDTNSPFRVRSVPGRLTTISFKIDGWMVRSQWISKQDAIAAGVKDDPQNPFIRIVLGAHRNYNFNPETFPPGEYWLMSFHLSTKDIPVWFWADFWHVNAPGRCDYTGCNDSYGYFSGSNVPAGVSRNFIPPATRQAPARDGGMAQLYITGTTYPAGTATPALATLLRKMGIGTGAAAGPMPAPGDPAWLSYRLRGSQWDFTDPAGRPSYVGATASNGGIVTGTSCVSCHATAGTLATGPSPQVLGVYFNWAGAPNAANFNLNARPATNLILQNDFVWGFMHTVPLKAAPAPAGTAAGRPSPGGRRGGSR
ncbi:MAG TPA: hypothetical protein VGC56_00640 [Allosphingosinicella sp.]